MASKTKLKEVQVQIVKHFWNDSITKKYIGQQGTITNLELLDPGEFKSVMISGKPIDFHIKEIEAFGQKNNTRKGS